MFQVYRMLHAPHNTTSDSDAPDDLSITDSGRGSEQGDHKHHNIQTNTGKNQSPITNQYNGKINNQLQTNTCTVIINVCFTH